MADTNMDFGNAASGQDGRSGNADAVRQMPYSAEAEQAVIGAMLQDRDAALIAAEMLQKEDFYVPYLAKMFEVLAGMANDAADMDIIVILEKFRASGLPAEYTEPGYLAMLMDKVPVTVNIRNYAKIVSDKALLRRIVKVNREISEACFKGEMAVDDVLDMTESQFLALLQKRGVGDMVPIRTIVRNALSKIEQASRQTGNVTGVPTGFIDLDYQTAGLQPSDLVLIAARPSMGKTAFALNIAQYVAFRKNLCVAVFSLEMSKEQLVNRLFSLESRLDAQKLRTGNLADYEWEKLIEGAGIIGQSKLIIDDTPSISVSELRSKCRKYKQDQGLSMVIIDYLQLMTVGGGSMQRSRQQEISDISRSLKAIAREMNVPVVALSQLNRGVEQRDDKRPMLSDLRDSGAIEQDADVVMFIYRDDYYNKDTEKKNISEIIIAKQRNGPVGTVNLAWLPEYTMFGNLERQGREG